MENKPVCAIRNAISLQITDVQYLRACRNLYFWRKGTSGSFMTGLFDLFQLADMKNFARLSEAFPAEALAIECWRACSSEAEFFKELFLKETEKQNERTSNNE